MSLRIVNRLTNLRQRLVEHDVDAILVSQPENRYYLSGFSGSSGYLLITAQNAILATDFRYLEQAKKQAPYYNIFHTANDTAAWFPDLIAGLNSERLGLEAGHITFAMYQQLNDILEKAKSQLKLVPTDGLVENIRAIKEPFEIEYITKAIEITYTAFEYIEDIIHLGMTEKEVAWEIEKFLRDSGSQGIPFDIIVASGPNSALPHAKPSHRTINSNEPVIIDMGASYEGYSSDLTRTICLGTSDDIFNKVYDTVLKAQQAALSSVEAGLTGNQADNIARKVIEQAGYGEAFGHALGHGIGLATHEQPRIGPNSSEKLVNGMVFTIEPGIYLSGWGGIRIENNVIMEDGKVRVISNARGTGNDK
jgi:Xaa-Pro aminopeptidase